MKLYITLDLETGGLDADDAGITEIAAVCGERSEDWRQVRIVERFSTLVRPEPGLHYHENAMELQHRTIDDLAGGMSERCALYAFYGWIRSFREWLSPWAHYAAFDKGFLMAAHERLNFGIAPEDTAWQMFPCGTDFKCSMALFKRLRERGVHTCANAKLDTVLQHYGIGLSDDARHTGAGDVEATALAVAAMMREYQICRQAMPYNTGQTDSGENERG